MKKFKYRILIWFRFSGFEKDFDEIEVEAENDEQALELAEKNRSWVYSADIISRDEIDNQKM
jgi:hypothetical protein